MKGLIFFYEKLFLSKNDLKIVLLCLNLRNSLGIVEKFNVIELCVFFIYFKMENVVDFIVFVLKNVMVYR